MQLAQSERAIAAFVNVGAASPSAVGRGRADWGSEALGRFGRSGLGFGGFGRQPFGTCPC